MGEMSQNFTVPGELRVLVKCIVETLTRSKTFPFLHRIYQISSVHAVTICVLCCRASFAALAQQTSSPTFGGLAQQGGSFGSPQPTGGFGAFGSTTSKFVILLVILIYSLIVIFCAVTN